MKFTTILKKPFTSLDVADQLSVTAFYFAIAAVVVMAALWAILKKFRPEKLPAYVKNVKNFAFGAASFFAVSMFALKVAADISSGEFKKAVFWSIFEIIATAAVVLLAGFAVKAAKPDFLRTYKFIAAGVMLVSLVAAAVVLALYYKDVKGKYPGSSQAGLYISAVALVALLVLASLLIGKKKSPFTTRDMAYAAVSVALAYALSYVKFLKMPQDGSVTLASMLPIMLFAYIFGIRKGIVVGVVYGVLQAVQDPYIIHPAQFLIDYPIAFGMLGFAGIFKEINIIKKPVWAFMAGAAIAITLRYVSHLLSGIFAFASYAQPGYTAVTWSLVYNLFTFLDGAIALAVAFVLFKSKSFMRLVYEKSATENIAD